ncbi:hypothetical protein QEO94_03455 [Kingella negevensis]|uniref:hypothetical protein n=1 Tax=Kingella negevensis TaxID=1522312 RepID=UPI0025438E24|nr:hypothetical protein [Kingella negevensis]WII93870.1 hypothetical protein QEO94_03455 [Kingella negevensis]
MGAIIFLLVVFAPYGLVFVLGLILLFKCFGNLEYLPKVVPTRRSAWIWVYAAILGYALFPVLYSDFSVRRDVGLYRWCNVQFWIIMAAAQLPLVPLLFRFQAAERVALFGIG